MNKNIAADTVKKISEGYTTDAIGRNYVQDTANKEITNRILKSQDVTLPRLKPLGRRLSKVLTKVCMGNSFGICRGQILLLVPRKECSNDCVSHGLW